MSIVLYILLPTMLMGLGVWIGVWYSRIKHKNVDTGVNTDIKEDRDKGIGKSMSRGNYIKVDERIANGFEELLGMMREKVEKERAEERDKELVRLARERHHNNYVNTPIAISVTDEGKPVRTKAKVVIPYNLSEIDKRILEEFYSDGIIE